GGRHTMQEIADTIGVGRATLYRHLELVEQVDAGVEARERRSASGSSAPAASTQAAARATEALDAISSRSTRAVIAKLLLEMRG
ncbi:MAG: hypothetical protein ACJ780_25700, partial [Solirubrobacteraceae bacterium]